MASQDQELGRKSVLVMRKSLSVFWLSDMDADFSAPRLLYSWEPPL